MTGKIKKIQSKINSEKITKASDQFESVVDFEFIPVIAYKSSFVDHVAWILSLIFVVLSVVTVDYLLNDSFEDRFYYYIIGFVCALILGNVLAYFDFISRLFISKAEKNRQVHEKAERIFFKNNCYSDSYSNIVSVTYCVCWKYFTGGLYHSGWCI